MRVVLIILLLSFLASCTNLRVRPLSKAYDVSHVCIKVNPKVVIDDFVEILQEEFQAHAITTEVFTGNRPDYCEYNLRYTALQSWDIGTYLSVSKIRLYKGNSMIASAEYSLKGKGGISPAKFKSVRRKLKNIMNELLAQY